MFSRILNILTSFILAFSILVSVLLGGVRLFGFTPYAVKSGSMEPKYKVGSVVYVKGVDPENIKVGDVITFMIGEDELATHRVIEVIKDEEGLKFRTKGDANNVSDANPVPASNVVGRVLFTIPGLGYLAATIGTREGKLMVIIDALILLVLIGLEGYLKRFG